MARGDRRRRRGDGGAAGHLHTRSAVTAFAARIAERVDRQARDADVNVHDGRLELRHSRAGVQVRRGQLVAAKLARTYPIAVGKAGLESTAGRYKIQEKIVNPPWHVPNSSWAGELAGRTIPAGDPQNPLEARWMGSTRARASSSSSARCRSARR